MEFNISDLLYSLPVLLLLATGLILMIVDGITSPQPTRIPKGHPNAGKALMPPAHHRGFLAVIAAIGLIISAVSAVPIGGSEPGFFAPAQQVLTYSRSIYFGGISSLITVFLISSALFSLFFIADYFRRHNKDLSDIYTLLVFAVIGMVLLANANDMVVLFIGLEIMSICLYIMAAMFRTEQSSNEAGLKYFLLGAFATGFLLYGIALMYGLTVSTHLDEYRRLNFGLLRTEQAILFYPAFILILIGFLFKVAAFPFHSWTPDVYTGAPTPLAGFMATGSKMAAFIAFAMFFYNIMPSPDNKILSIVGVLSLASMFYGNIVAMQQKNVKRMLAYSSIAHTGYLLLGLCAGREGYMSVIFYMVVYTFMTIGAFGIISILESKNEDTDINNWKGLGFRQPWPAVAMATFLFSLAGMPPLAGFMAKYYVFVAAIRADLIWLATLGILTSVMGAYYYINVIVYMYFKPVDTEAAQVGMYKPQLLPVIGAITLVILLIYIGIYPTRVANFIEKFYGAAGYWAVM
jgi:NADH-quinone oxidoreductase subunit N